MAFISQPFRRYSNPLLVPVAEEATVFAVPPNFFTELESKFGGPMTSFRAFNPNLCDVRLVGTSRMAEQPMPQPTLVTLTTGWAWGPKQVEIAGTQYPVFMSAMYFPTPGIERPSFFLPIEISYGIGI